MILHDNGKREIELADLMPPDITIKIGKKDYKLAILTIKNLSLLDRHFAIEYSLTNDETYQCGGGLDKLLDELATGQQIAYLRLFHYLIDHPQNDFGKFCKLLRKKKVELTDVVKIIGQSFYNPIKKIKSDNKKSSNKSAENTSWITGLFASFDCIATRYTAYTFDKLLDLTLLQVSILIAIHKQGVTTDNEKLEKQKQQAKRKQNNLPRGMPHGR